MAEPRRRGPSLGRTDVVMSAEHRGGATYSHEHGWGATGRRDPRSHRPESPRLSSLGGDSRGGVRRGGLGESLSGGGCDSRASRLPRLFFVVDRAGDILAP
jgi:hypothetical protein